MKTRDIRQEVIIPASPTEVFDAWMDRKTHGEMIGADVKIDPKIGGTFDIWDGYAIGETLELDPKNLKIVQSWRDESWPEDHYSKISLIFKSHDDNKTTLIFTQIGIPAEHAGDIKEGWEDYYWQPMKDYFGNGKKNNRKI